MHYWSDCLHFYRQFRSQYTTTGAVLPSSPGLARASTRFLRRSAGPRRILEVGPGTGAVTADIVRQLRPGDVFDIVEINPAFVAHIERRFETEPEFRRKRSQCRLMHAAVQTVAGQGGYDFLISGVPLNNFELAQVQEIVASYRRLLTPEGILSYFEYLAVRDLRLPFVSEAERQRLTSLSGFLAEQTRRYQVAADIIWLNVPPAVVRHLRFGA